MGHVIEHIALETQNISRYGYWVWKNSWDKTWDLQCCFSYTEENVGLFAAESAVSIAEALIAGTDMIWKAIYKKCAKLENVRLNQVLVAL
jgi:cyanophycin synthetase